MYNKSLDTASIESMRKALAEVEVNEADRAKHYKGATPPEDMKNNRKGKGAQDMMKPADDAVANPAADEQDIVNKDAATMTANVKIAKKRRNDKDVGDKDIVEPGTPMKDPAVVKPPVKEDMDNKMFVLRKQAQANQRRIDKGMKPITPLHPDHKNLIKPMKKKKANEEKEMDNIKPRWILDAYKEMYEDVQMSEKSSVNYKDVDGKTVTEISKDLTKAYIKGRSRDMFFTGKKAGEEDIKSTIGMKRPSYKKSPERKAMKMMKGMDTAVNKLTGKAKVPAQGKTGRNVKDQY